VNAKIDSNDPLRVSVVIPTFGDPENVRRAVRSAMNQDLPPDQYEIIVVDSSPDDRVVRTVEALRPGARCALRVLTKPAEGPGPSRNLGAGAARGEVIALMDSDCIATPGWLRFGLAAFGERVGLVQGRTLPVPDVPLGIFTWYVRVEQENHIYEAANLFYCKTAFAQAGGFDTAFNDAAEHVMGGEDVDLAWRVKRLGWTSRFSAEALVYHEVQRLPFLRWVYIRRHYIWPLVARRVPEIRAFFWMRWFFDRHQAALLPALIGAVWAVWIPAALLLAVPYIISRGSEPTRTLRGPLRIVRVAAYSLRDVASLFLLVAGSVRFRTLVL